MPDCPGTLVLDDGRRCTFSGETVELDFITIYKVTQCHYNCVDERGLPSIHMIRRKRLFWIFSWLDDD